MEDAKNRILQTALDLFLKKSYKSVTFEELMEKTGYSKGAFFYYFKNKLEIFEAVIDMYIDQFTSVDFAKFTRGSMRDFLDAYFTVASAVRSDLFASEMAFTANHYSMMFEALRLIPDFKRKIVYHEEKAISGWRNVIATARQNKEIKSILSDEQLVRLFIDAGHGVIIHLIMTDNTTAIEKRVFAAWNNLYLLIKV